MDENHNKLKQIQGSWVRSRPGPILSWRMIMRWFLRPFSSLPLIQEALLSGYKRNNVHEILVNFLVKLAQEKVCLGQLGRKESNQTKKKKKTKKKQT